MNKKQYICGELKKKEDEDNHSESTKAGLSEGKAPYPPSPAIYVLNVQYAEQISGKSVLRTEHFWLYLQSLNFTLHITIFWIYERTKQQRTAGGTEQGVLLVGL